MSTNWVITTAVDRLTLDDTMHGEVTFTVSNPDQRADRVVFDVVPGEGADPSWFAVEEPQRRVPPGGSVSYVVKAALPPGAPAGSYTVQGRVYSADSAPEESSVLSGRLAIEVKGAPPPEKRKIPWWVWVVVAALLAIVLAVVLFLVLRDGGGEEEPQAQPSATAGVVDVPDVSRQSEEQAATNLRVFGLSVGTVRHKHDAANANQVLYQSVAPGSNVPRGTVIDLVVTVNLSAPAITAPANGSVLNGNPFVGPAVVPVPVTPRVGATPSPSAAPAAPRGVIQWTQKEAWVTRWRVDVIQDNCATLYHLAGPATNTHCQALAPVTWDATTNSFTPYINFLPGGGVPSFKYTGQVRFSIYPLDDFGNPGARTAFFAILVRY